MERGKHDHDEIRAEQGGPKRHGKYLRYGIWADNEGDDGHIKENKHEKRIDLDPGPAWIEKVIAAVNAEQRHGGQLDGKGVREQVSDHITVRGKRQICKAKP